ncbi:alpha/beta hydrolase [Solitalea sp. MAHUQ-68]|uniref:Alpha/beta hydrolase n=1 Tax=Solitalea agri TaxID=2953739 RepID=A0A9X2F596_9SPHI|nr:alpha/beta hydrolase [Solitalea agri]MCO4294424.1 alpha/beta hydrolase [Solitalea agri]
MKCLKIVLLASLLSFFNIAFGQIIKKDKGKVNNQEFSFTYIEPTQEIKGVLLLLPGWGESPQSIYEKTKLPYLLGEKGFVTIVPELRQTLFADDYTISELNAIIKIQSKRYGSNDLNLIVGGLSAGGAIAINYAEYVLKTDTTIGLKAVFAIDPPLDLNRIYTSAENKIKYNCKNRLIRKEGSFIKNHLLHTLQGSPKENPEEYLKYSVYSANALDGGNAKVLNELPIRLYSEPDLDYVRKTYCDELQYEDINAIDLEKLSKFLANIGNTRSEYITTKGKGFHSWNILDPSNCVDWILSICNETSGK